MKSVIRMILNGQCDVAMATDMENPTWPKCKVTFSLFEHLNKWSWSTDFVLVLTNTEILIHYIQSDFQSQSSRDFEFPLVQNRFSDLNIVANGWKYSISSKKSPLSCKCSHNNRESFHLPFFPTLNPKEKFITGEIRCSFLCAFYRTNKKSRFPSNPISYESPKKLFKIVTWQSWCEGKQSVELTVCQWRIRLVAVKITWTRNKTHTKLWMWITRTVHSVVWFYCYWMLLLCRVLNFVGSRALCAFCAQFIGIDFHLLFVAYPRPNGKGHNSHKDTQPQAHKLNESGEESRGNFSKFTYVCGHFFIIRMLRVYGFIFILIWFGIWMRPHAFEMKCDLWINLCVFSRSATIEMNVRYRLRLHPYASL